MSELRGRCLAPQFWLIGAHSGTYCRISVRVLLAHLRWLAPDAHHNLQFLELDTGELRWLDDERGVFQLAFLAAVFLAAAHPDLLGDHLRGAVLQARVH